MIGLIRKIKHKREQKKIAAYISNYIDYRASLMIGDVSSVSINVSGGKFLGCKEGEKLSVSISGTYVSGTVATHINGVKAIKEDGMTKEDVYNKAVILFFDKCWDAQSKTSIFLRVNDEPNKSFIIDQSELDS